MTDDRPMLEAWVEALNMWTQELHEATKEGNFMQITRFMFRAHAAIEVMKGVAMRCYLPKLTSLERKYLEQVEKEEIVAAEERVSHVWERAEEIRRKPSPIIVTPEPAGAKISQQ